MALHASPAGSTLTVRKVARALIAAFLLTFLVPQPSFSVPIQTSAQDGLFEFGRFVGKYSVSTDGSVSGKNISVSKEVGATNLEAAYLVLVSQGASNRPPCSSTASMTLSGQAVDFTHLSSGGVFGSANTTAFCNYFVDLTASLSASLSNQSAGTVVGFPVLYDTSKYTGVALTAIFDNPSRTESGTVIYQFGHAPATGATTTISFAAIPAALPSSSAILSVGIGWSVQTSQFVAGANPPTEGYNTLRVGTSGNPSPSILSAYAGGYDDGSENNYGAEFITVGDFADNPAIPNGAWVNNRTDDELYDISGFLAAGDTSLTLFSENGSVNDTIFQIVLQLKSISSGFNVTFDPNGGSGTMPIQVGAGNTALSANTLQRSGHNFAGWNTSANGQGTTYSDTAIYPFIADETLFAQWTEVQTPPAADPAPQPATYLGPVPEALNPNPVFSSQSNNVTLIGKRLQGITRAQVNRLEIVLRNVGPEAVAMTLPSLSAGVYTIVYYSDAGTLSHQNSLTVVNRPLEAVTGEQAVANEKRFFVRKRFTAFIGDTPNVSALNRSGMFAYLRGIGAVDRVTCVGSTSGIPAEVTDVSLARARARFVCDQVKILNPNAEVNIRVSTGKGVGQFFRAATIFAVGSR